MTRIVFIALVHLAAWRAAVALIPSLARSRARFVVWAAAVVSVAAWLRPMFGGRGTSVGVGLLGGSSGWSLFSAAWTVGVLGTALLGGFWLGAGMLARRLRSTDVETPVNERRRRFLTGVGRGIPMAAMATGSVGVVAGSRGFVVRRETVALPGLPEALNGFKIGQITDVHVGAFVDPEDVRGAVAAMNAEGTHLQVMTGDLIDDLERLHETMEALGTCTAPHGMLAVLGNHEHWRGLPPIRRAYASAAARGRPLRLLVDESHLVEHEGAPLRVVGVDYPMGFRSRESGMKRSAEAAFVGVQPGETVLCLSHHPDFFPHAADRGAHLTLSGHTHGGQVAFLGIPAFSFAFRHMLGRYRRADRHLYVSGGTGHWLPFRLGVPAEVTIVTLRRA